MFAEGRDRHRAFAVWGTAGGSGMILGSLLGGVLTQAFGWTAVFLVNAPLAAIALAAGLRRIRSCPCGCCASPTCAPGCARYVPCHRPLTWRLQVLGGAEGG